MSNRRKYTIPDCVSQAEAGRIVGVAKQSVPAAIARGDLEGVPMAGLVFVTRESALAYRARREAERLAGEVEAGAAEGAAA